MKILKNVLISVLIGHLAGLLVCAAGAFWALEMPNADTSAAVFGMASCTVGVLAMAIASKKLSGGSVLCSLLCGACYLLLSFCFGRLTYGAGKIGIYEIAIAAQSVLIPLVLCFSGVTFMGRKRRVRRISKKIFK